MPMRPMRRCAHPGCRMLTDNGYCPQHMPKKKRGTSEGWHYLYTSPRFHWTERRTQQLLREPLCRICARRGVRTVATDVDHVVPHRGDVRLFMTGELQSLCHSCHSAKTMAENAEGMAAAKTKN